MRWYTALIVDVLVVVVFAVAAHLLLPTSLDDVRLLNIFWPFAVGLGVAWSLLRTVLRRLKNSQKGVIVWGDTVAVGVLVRAFLTPTALTWSFLLTSAGLLGVGLIGWRLILDATRHRKARTTV